MEARYSSRIEELAQSRRWRLHLGIQYLEQISVEKILTDFKNNKADEAEFWIPSLAPKILNIFIALRDSSGKYIGILEYILDFTAIEQIAEVKKDAPKR